MFYARLFLVVASLCLISDKSKKVDKPTAHVRSLWVFFHDWRPRCFSFMYSARVGRYLLSRTRTHAYMLPRQVANCSGRVSLFSFSFAHRSVVSLSPASHWTVCWLSHSHALGSFVALVAGRRSRSLSLACSLFFFRKASANRSRRRQIL